MLDGNKYVNLKRLLNLYGELFVREYKKRLKSDGTYASGNAARSLEYDVKIGQLESELSILGEQYITAINDGRGQNKQAPPSTAILKWMNTKGIRFRDSKGRFTTLSDYKMRGVAYVIARSIGKKGTIKRFNNTGTGLIDIVYNNIADVFGEELLEAFGQDIEYTLERYLKDIK
tara:strand:- start:12970 stop:13491 length:522 start_codon:yes stop_codon:yes gene_type:complete